MKYSYYSLFFYFGNNIAMIGLLIYLVLGLFEPIFAIPTYRTNKGEIDVSPKQTRVFLSLFASILSLFLIVNFLRLYVPVIFSTPKVLSGTSLEIYGEILSSNRVVIAGFWFICFIYICFYCGKQLLFTLTKRVKKKNEKTEIGIWGIEYTIFLMLQAVVSSFLILILIGTYLGVYNSFIQGVWNSLVVTEFLLTLINGFFTHQKISIFTNGLITYSKYNKKGYGRKEDIEIFIDESDVIIIKIYGTEKVDIFSVWCSAEMKKEILESISYHKFMSLS